MVAKCKANTQLLKRVAEIYEWLDSQIRQSAETPDQCDACGKCCNFARFDHRLFVTPPELMYLTAMVGNENIKPMPTGRCPYNTDGKCTVYDYRFAGCRIFSCKSNPDFQSRLTESTLNKLKSLCTRFQIPYRYSDLPTALSSLTPA
jgi:Fe-S-cluster containining protein